MHTIKKINLELYIPDILVNTGRQLSFKKLHILMRTSNSRKVLRALGSEIKPP